MISKLGYVPKESRGGDHAPEYFDTETVTAADRSKFRTRKRAKKASVVSRILAGIVALVVLGGIGFGIWFLVGSGADDKGNGLTYAALSKPCDKLDPAPIKDITKGSDVKATKDEVEKHAHSTEQFCEASFGKPGEGGSVAVNTQVFKRDAGAKNAYEDALDEAELNAKEATETGGGEQLIEPVEGIGSKAFSNTRKAAKGSKTVDYTLVYYQDNAFIETRLSVYNGAASLSEVKGYTKAVAQKYMENWAAA